MSLGFKGLAAEICWGCCREGKLVLDGSAMNDDARSVGTSGGVRERSSGQEEIGLRFMFLEAIMERARKSDVEGVEEALNGMALAGLDAGPRAYHGLVVAYTRARDSEGAVRFIMPCPIAHFLLRATILCTVMSEVLQFLLQIDLVCLPSHC